MYLISLPHFFLFFFSTFLFFVGFILEGESERLPHAEIETQKYKDRTRKTNMVNKIFKIAENWSVWGCKYRQSPILFVFS